MCPNHTQKLGDGLYMITDGAYHSMFIDLRGWNSRGRRAAVVCNAHPAAIAVTLWGHRVPPNRVLLPRLPGGKARTLHFRMTGSGRRGIVHAEAAMGIKERVAITDRQSEQAKRQHDEIDWTLNAIAGAIVTGRLPPDDAFAWARIAAHEVESQARQ